MLGLVVVLPPNCVSGSAEQPPFIPKSAAAGLRLNALTPAPPGMRTALGMLGLLVCAVSSDTHQGIRLGHGRPLLLLSLMRLLGSRPE